MLDASRGDGPPKSGTGRRGPWQGRRVDGWSDRRTDRRAEAPATPELAPAERAREICLRLLAVRPRTRLELTNALRQRGIAEDVAAEVLDVYGEVGIIDDQAFARAWVTSRHHGKGLAGRALAGELRRKGVDAEAIGEALDEISGETEARTARALVDRRLRGERPGQPEATMRRLVGMLARKGYPPGLAFRVVKDAMADAAGSELSSGDIFIDELEEALEAAALEESAE